MIGTIVNAGTILAGSVIGSALRKGIKQEYQSALYNAMGFAATALDLDGRFNRLTNRFAKSNLGQGLSTAILLFCIGTLSILGPIESAVHGDHTYLFTNATLDFVTSMVLASTYGIGIAAAAPVLFCWQGGIYLGAGFLSSFLTQELLTEISIVGGILIAASGLSILKIKDAKSLNMLPALAVPVLWFLIKGIFHF